MDTGEVETRTRAALDLAGTYVFGTEPGGIPALLFEAYQASAADLDRALLAATLARCWAYSGEHHRAFRSLSARSSMRRPPGSRP